MLDRTESTGSGGVVKIKKLTKIHDGSTKFPKMEECAHFHYDFVELGPLQISLVPESADSSFKENESGNQSDAQYSILVQSHDRIWTTRRTYENFRTFDKQLHRCIFDRKYSLLPELRKNEVRSEDVPALRKLMSLYLHRFSVIAGNMINCGTVLYWFEMDNRGHRLIVTDESAINIPAVAAAHVVKRYTTKVQDEISLEVGDIISLIDMPPSEETQWWRGKRGFEVGFFPQECVEVISDKIPTSMTSKIPQTPPKPVLRKRGKLISFLRTFFTSRPSKTALKRTGIMKERVFGCDLGEHLLNSGLDVPLVLKSCAETIETHGIQDGIYRLSGVASNIQRLRSDFDDEQIPDLTADIYLQDIHSISSLLKMYFRELPNPLLTYQLYEKFAAAVQDEDNRLIKIHDVVQMLPPPHYRTAEYLFKHLARVANYGRETGMHCKNLAIVWAPNLMRSKDLELKCTTAALQGVGIQAIVTEFMISYADLIFSDKIQSGASGAEGSGATRRPRPKSLAISTPTKLLSLEEAREQILCGHTSPRQKYIDVGGGPSSLPSQYHTVIDVSNKKYRGKSQRSPAVGWRHLFNRKSLGAESVQEEDEDVDGNKSPIHGCADHARALTEEDLVQRRKLRTHRSVEYLLSGGSLPIRQHYSDPVEPTHVADSFNAGSQSLDRTPKHPKRSQSYDYTQYHARTGSESSNTYDESVDGQSYGAIPKVKTSQNKSPKSGKKQKKRGKKMKRSPSEGHEIMEAKPCFPMEDTSPPRPTPPLLPGAIPKLQAKDTAEKQYNTSSTFPTPASIESFSDFSLVKSTDSPTFSESVMLALTPTSPRKKIKAPPVPPTVGSLDRIERPMEDLTPSPVQSQNDTAFSTFDTGFVANESDYAKYQSPTEPMVPIELQESPNARRSLISKLNQSSDDIEMTGVVRTQSSAENLTDDEVFRQEQNISYDSDTDPRNDIQPEISRNEFFSSPDHSQVHCGMSEENVHSDLYVYSSRETSDMDTLHSGATLSSVTTATTDNTLCPTELSQSLDSVLQKVGPDLYQSGSEFDTATDTQTDRNSSSVQHTSTSESDMNNALQYADTLQGYKDALAQLPVTSSSEEDKSWPDPPDMAHVLETDIDSVITPPDILQHDLERQSPAKSSSSEGHNADYDQRESDMAQVSIAPDPKSDTDEDVYPSPPPSDSFKYYKYNGSVNSELSDQSLDEQHLRHEVECDNLSASCKSARPTDIPLVSSYSPAEYRTSPEKIVQKSPSPYSPYKQQSLYSPISAKDDEPDHHSTPHDLSPQSETENMKIATPTLDSPMKVQAAPNVFAHKTFSTSIDKESPCDDVTPLPGDLEKASSGFMTSDGYIADRSSSSSPTVDFRLRSAPINMPGVIKEVESPSSPQSTSGTSMDAKTTTPDSTISAKEMTPDEMHLFHSTQAEEEPVRMTPEETHSHYSAESEINVVKTNDISMKSASSDGDISGEVVTAANTSEMMFPLEDVPAKLNDSNDDVFIANQNEFEEVASHSDTTTSETAPEKHSDQDSNQSTTFSSENATEESSRKSRKKISPVKRKKSVRELLSRFEDIRNSPPNNSDDVRTPPTTFQKPKLVRLYSSGRENTNSSEADTVEGSPEIEPSDIKTSVTQSHKRSKSAPADALLTIDIEGPDSKSDVTTKSNNESQGLVRPASNAPAQKLTSSSKIRNKIKAFEPKHIENVCDRESDDKKLQPVTIKTSHSPPAGKTSPKLLPKPCITSDKTRPTKEKSLSPVISSDEKSPLSPLARPKSLSERMKAFESFRDEKDNTIAKKPSKSEEVKSVVNDTNLKNISSNSESLTTSMEVEDTDEVLKPSELFSQRSRRLPSSVKSNVSSSSTSSSPQVIETSAGRYERRPSDNKWRATELISTDSESSSTPPTTRPKPAASQPRRRYTDAKDIELHIATTTESSSSSDYVDGKGSNSVKDSAYRKKASSDSGESSGSIREKAKNYAKKAVLVEEEPQISPPKVHLEKENVRPSRASVRDLWQKFEQQSSERHSTGKTENSVRKDNADEENNGKPWSTIL